MGKYSEGILGNFLGKVGTVVGSKWKGIHYMRSKGSKRSGQYSARQLEQQARFAKATRFIQPLNPVLRIGFQTLTRANTPLNVALSEVLLRAIGGDYPDYTINYAALRVARGILPVAADPQVSVEGGQIRFSWQYQPGQAGASADDEVVLLAIGENGEVSYSLLQARRADQTALLALPMGAVNTPVHCYIALVSSSGKEVSNSLYLGAVLAVN